MGHPGGPALESVRYLTSLFSREVWAFHLESRTISRGGGRCRGKEYDGSGGVQGNKAAEDGGASK